MALASLSSRPIGGQQTAPTGACFSHLLGGPTITLGAGPSRPPPVIPTLAHILLGQLVNAITARRLCIETDYAWYHKMSVSASVRRRCCITRTISRLDSLTLRPSTQSLVIIARRSVSLKILLSHSKSQKVIRNYTIHETFYRYSIVTMSLSCTVSEIFNVE